MATAFTHAFVGSALAVAGPEGVPRTRLLLTLAVLAALPDLDVAAFAVGIPYDHWLGHRGLTHSLPFAAAAGLVAAAVLFPEVPRFTPRWWQLALLLASATATHGLLDAFTDAGLGVGLFVPVDGARIFFPWRPLPTSPIGVAAFFRGPGAQILAVEVLLVWVPVLLVAGTMAALRRALAGFLLLAVLVVVSGTTALSLGAYCLTSDTADTRGLPWDPLQRTGARTG